MRIKVVTIENIDEVIRQARDAIYKMYFAKQECNVLEKSKYSSRYNELEQMVIDSNNPYCAYKFAREIQNSNIPALEQVVINNNEPYLCKAFAVSIRKANIEKLQKAVIDSGNVEAIYSFAIDVKRADVYLLGNALKANGCNCLYTQLMDKIHGNER